MRLVIEQRAETDAEGAGDIHQRRQRGNQLAVLDLADLADLAVAPLGEFFPAHLAHLAQLAYLRANLVFDGHSASFDAFTLI